MTTTKQLRTPTRSGTSNDFPDVNCKLNQPRDEGTNPHQEVDLHAFADTPVFAVWQGWVVTASGGQVDLYLDLDQDQIQDDSAWATYMHLNRIDVTEEEYIQDRRQVGLSGGSPAHLHFGIRKSSGLWAPNERYYPQGWNAGKDLDFVCPIKQSGNVVKATAYTKDNGVTKYLYSGDVHLHHRDSTAIPWQEEDMTLVSGSQTQWQFDLGPVYPVGTAVRYMVVARRWDMTNPYQWGFFPAKFQQPAYDTDNGPDESWAYDYLTLTLQ